MPASTTRVARLNDADLSALERSLDRTVSRLGGRAERGDAKPSQNAPQTNRAQLERICSEIVGSARRGIRIASQAESRPLVPLYRESKLELPPAIKVDLESRYDFYSVEVVFSSLLPRDQYL